MKWRAKVIVNDVNKKGFCIHFCFTCYYAKFAIQNIKLHIRPVYRNIFLILLFLHPGIETFSQFFPLKNYPKNYFIYPVAATNSISANFGELRPNHFHMGLDCRTDKAQNKKVLATAAGYIAKVKIEPWGFGRALYINHPNGFTTLYAHVNGFYPELEKYIKEQQYKLKSWNIYLDIPENLFPVSQGMFIAFSGNTGGSQGPHLHFEIRDTKTDKVLNPLLFGFPIPDTVAPDVFQLAVYDRCLSTYEQSPKLYPLKKVNGIYVTAASLITANTDKVSFGISASDRYTGSKTRNGIYETVLYENHIPIIGFQLDSISYDETRYINAHIDYKHKSSGGSYIQHVSKLPGYINSIYKFANGDGVIIIDDDSIHKIKLEVKDANGNTSVVQFNIQQDEKFTGSETDDSTTYFQQNSFHPGFINTFENSNISFYLPENSLYDFIHFQYREVYPNTGNTIYQLHNTSVPLMDYFPVTIKAATAFPDKMIMQRFTSGKNDYKKAEPVITANEPGWFRARFREFGSFQLMIDTLPPTITPIGFRDGMNCSKLKRIIFAIKDDTEEIENFTAALDGNWLCFSNDKGSRFIYEFDEMCPAGEHELKITVKDQVGNTAEKTFRFIR